MNLKISFQSTKLIRKTQKVTQTIQIRNKYYQDYASSINHTKKKPKKEKITLLGTQNLKKRTNQQKRNLKSQSKVYSEDSDQNNIKNRKDQQSDQQSYKQFKSVSNSFRNYPGRRSNVKLQINDYSNLDSQHPFCKQQVHFPPRSESEYSVHKRTINYLIKAPCQPQNINQIQGKEQKEGLPKIPLFNLQKSQPKQKPQVLDILKAEGILENGQYGNRNFFNRPHSVKSSRSGRSFSMCSDSHLDMFDQDPGFPRGMKQLSELDSQSQIFNNQHNL